jgi:hypothetical protein
VLGASSGFLYGATGFQPASTRLSPLSDPALRGLVSSGILRALTFTCVPVGSGSRTALDRDGDGFADYDEILAGKNPNNASSHP